MKWKIKPAATPPSKPPRRKFRIVLLIILAVLIVWAAVTAAQQKAIFGDMEQYEGLEGIAVVLTNSSSQTLNGWYLVYDGGQQLPLETVAPGASWTTTVNTDNTPGDCTLELHWLDPDGSERQQTIMALYKQGYDGQSAVTVTEDAAGLLKAEPRTSYY